MQSLEQKLRSCLSRAFEKFANEPVDPMLQRSQRADYQSNAALKLANRLNLDPREVANKVVAIAALDELCKKVEVSGPGFINLTIADDALGHMLGNAAADIRFGVALLDPETIVVDYSAPNAAKEMHVGHLRSTIIGDAAVRVLEWLGLRVISHNHLGDWGTPFGMLIEHLLDIGEAEAALELSMGDLNGFYTAARKKFDNSEEFRKRSRQRVVLLQNGDKNTSRLWDLLVTDSKQYFMSVYSRLDTQLTESDFVGESAYNEHLPSVVNDLRQLGLLHLSDGAECAFPPGFVGREGQPLPLIVRKSDGGYGYAATDLAALRHRIDTLGATRLLYVVGMPQRQHLEMVFATAVEAGWMVSPVCASHIGFGSVLGANGKVLRSRLGSGIRLVDLLDEAVDRATALIKEKNPDLDVATVKHVAQAVGIGAVKYADLSTDRVKDYTFDFDRMLSFDGNTAPYLQYAHARIQSIFRRGGILPNPNGSPLFISEPAERTLAIELLRFQEIVLVVAETMEFHHLANYLYDLSNAFTAFYERCTVLNSEEPIRTSRLNICSLTARVLSTGLSLLGITAPERM